jgi:hypothetical protein
MQRGQGPGPAVCDHVQPAVDRQPQRMVANDGPKDPGARAGLRPLAWPATDLLGGPCEAVAAVGDDHGEAGTTGLAAGLPPSSARPVPAAHQKRGRFTQEDCLEDGASDTSPCPAGARRTCRCATVALGRPIRSDATSAGPAGPRTPQGPRHTGGRRLPRWVDEPLCEEMAQRVRRRPEVRKQRQQRVEPPCGTMKSWWDAGSCLMRGWEQVRTACSVTVLADTLRRVVHLVERPRRRAARGGAGLGPAIPGEVVIVCR